MRACRSINVSGNREGFHLVFPPDTVDRRIAPPVELDEKGRFVSGVSGQKGRGQV